MEKFSVKKPFTVLVAVVMVLILGFVAITKMQTNLLPDGTHIWLNAGSVLRYYGDLTGRRRVVELDGATASTALRFTSEPASGEFSRWFIDDICVTK